MREYDDRLVPEIPLRGSGLVGAGTIKSLVLRGDCRLIRQPVPGATDFGEEFAPIRWVQEDHLIAQSAKTR
jgi:hypothetical protein